jgi:hypothetical protein
MVADLSWKATLTALLSRRHTAFRFSHPACLFQISTSGRIRDCFRRSAPRLLSGPNAFSSNPISDIAVLGPDRQDLSDQWEQYDNFVELLGRYRSPMRPMKLPRGFCRSTNDGVNAWSVTLVARCGSPTAQTEFMVGCQGRLCCSATARQLAWLVPVAAPIIDCLPKVALILGLPPISRGWCLRALAID